MLCEDSKRSQAVGGWVGVWAELAGQSAAGLNEGQMASAALSETVSFRHASQVGQMRKSPTIAYVHRHTDKKH